MESKFDDELNKMLNEEVNIPQKITNKIRSSLEEKRKGVYVGMKLNKVVATIVGIVIMSAGAVIAGKAIIEKRNSIEIAEENGYFEKVDMDYVYDAGIGIKIEKYFIDQNRVAITFNMQTEEFDITDLDNSVLLYSKAYIEGNNITHESQTNVKYCMDIIKFIDEKGDEIQRELVTGRGASISESEKVDDNTVRFFYEMPLYQEIESNKMKVVIQKIGVLKNLEEKEFIGNWEFEIDIADKYLNHSNIIEYQGRVNLQDVVVEKATLSATKLVVSLKADNLKNLLSGIDNKEEPVFTRLFGEKGEYDNAKIGAERAMLYDKNEMIFRFNISNFNAENVYEIALGEMVITLTRNN